MFPIVLALQRSTWFAPVLITTGQHADLVRPILDLAEIGPDGDLADAVCRERLIGSRCPGIDSLCDRLRPVRSRES